MTTAERIFTDVERARLALLRDCTLTEVERLDFLRWRIQTGRLQGDWPMKYGDPSSREA